MKKKCLYKFRLKESLDGLESKQTNMRDYYFVEYRQQQLKLINLTSLTFEHLIIFRHEKNSEISKRYSIFFTGIIDPGAGFDHHLFYLPRF